MQIDMEVADLILRVVQVVVLPFLVWLVRCIWLIRRDLAALEAKHCSLEETVENLPTESALHNLAMLIERQSGQITSMNNIMVRVEQVVTRHEDYLRENK